MSKSVLTLGTSAKRKRPRRAAVNRQLPVVIDVAPVVDDAARRAMIAEAAYYRAERRDFAPGFEVEDWLQSESEVDASYRSRPAACNADLH